MIQRNEMKEFQRMKYISLLNKNSFTFAKQTRELKMAR